MNPCFAIIDSNTLSRTCLRDILWETFNQVEICCYGSADAFIRDSNRHFVHFFVSSDILFANTEEFETLKSQTTVLSTGPEARIEAAGFGVLDVSQQEDDILRCLMKIQIGQRMTEPTAGKKMKETLSAREKDVLTLMVKGLINKEIADRLNISLTTVIFHRNNICTKLGTRSIGRLTVYAVLEGLIGINEI